MKKKSKKCILVFNLVVIYVRHYFWLYTNCNGGYKMEQFLNWAFYDHAYKHMTTDEIYKCYEIYCDLFKCDKLSKFKFIELYQAYMRE